MKVVCMTAKFFYMCFLFYASKLNVSVVHTYVPAIHMHADILHVGPILFMYVRIVMYDIHEYK